MTEKKSITYKFFFTKDFEDSDGYPPLPVFMSVARWNFLLSALRELAFETHDLFVKEPDARAEFGDAGKAIVGISDTISDYIDVGKQQIDQIKRKG